MPPHAFVYAVCLLFSLTPATFAVDGLQENSTQTADQPETRLLQLIKNAVQQRKNSLDRMMDSFYNATAEMIRNQRTAADRLREAIRTRIGQEVRRADGIVRLDSAVEEVVKASRQSFDNATLCVKSVVDQILEIPFQFANRVIQTLDQTLTREFVPLEASPQVTSTPQPKIE